MATVTPAEVQAELGTNPMNAQIIRAEEVIATTKAEYYVIGNVDAPGRARWIETTNTDDAATQAAAILAALIA